MAVPSFPLYNTFAEPFIDSFCQPNFNGTWSSIANELGAFTPCFIDIIILGSAHITMVVCSLLRLYALLMFRPRERITPKCRFFHGLSSVLVAFCAIVPLMQLSAHESLGFVSDDKNFAPFEVVSLILSFAAFASIFIVLIYEFRWYVRKGAWYLRFAMTFVLVGQLAKLRYVLLIGEDLTTFFMRLFFAYTAAQVVLDLLAFFYYPSLLPLDIVSFSASTGVVREEEEEGKESMAMKSNENDYMPLLDSEETNICPERKANVLSKILFSWMTPLLVEGYKHPLSDEDVWKLDEHDRSKNVFYRFSKSWEKEMKKKDANLLRALHSCFGLRFWLGGFFKIGNDASQFVGPAMLSLLLVAMETNEAVWHEYVYAFIIFFGVTGGVLCEAQYFQNAMRTGFQIRQALVAALFSKSLRLSHGGKRGITSGRILNMMNSDTESLQTICQQLHNLWSAPLRIIVAMAFLYAQLGVAAIFGLFVLILLIPTQALIVNRVQKMIKSASQKTDQRLGLMNEILAAMDVIKCYVWESSFKKKVMDVRKEEMDRLKVAQYTMALNYFLLNVAPVLVTVIGFSVYVLLGGELTASKAFTSISLFSVLKTPLYTFPQLITQVVNANVSLKRIQEMLLAEERNLDPFPEASPDLPAVEIDGMSFSWDPSYPPFLQNVQLSIPRGSLVAVVGGTGQGKSSLLSAMLGEMPSGTKEKEVVIRGRVAYVSQVSWIFNSTIKQNILFGLPFDAQTYRQAVSVSALEKDFEILPGGDETEIGERGVNLSGGQKQRVSIARAVYSDADIVVLDDPLSALDAHVAKQVFDDCVCQSLKGKTRIMATNQIHFLPYVDHIVVIQNGRIVEQGNYTQLCNEGECFKKLIQQAGSLEEAEEKKEKGEGEGEASKVLTVEKEGKEEGKKEGTVLVVAEERETGRVSMEVIGRYVNAMGGSFALVLVLGLYTMIELARVSSSLWVSLWSSESSTTTHPVKYYITIYSSICFTQMVFALFNQFWLARCSLKAANTLHVNMLSCILRAPLSFFHVNPIGRILNRFSKDTSDIDKNLAQYVSLGMGAVFQLVSTFALIGVLNTVALWAIVPLLVVFYFAYLYFQNSAREVKRLDSVTRSPVYAQFNEALNGQSTIRAYRANERMADINAEAMNRNVRFTLVSMSANRWLAIRLEFLGGLMILAVAIFAILDVQKAEDQSAVASTMGLILSYSLSITSMMTMVLRLSSMAENSFNSVERVGNYSDVLSEADTVIEDSRPPPDWPTAGSVLFDNVVMRYRPDLPPVLKGLTFDVRGGERLGVVGRTGAGKSSLFNALFRLTEIQSGRICIDGYDLKSFGLHDVRSALMIIPQVPVLFTGTIRSNLDPFENYDDAQIWEALKKAHLSDVIAQLPHSLNTQVSEGGENLSVGQRQLLSLARALLRKNRILVLDEATAAVDVGTDSLIQKTIREGFEACTLLVIAHRLNTIIDSDRILVMEAGLAIEHASPSDLLKNENGMFCSMVKSTGNANAQYLMKIARGEESLKVDFEKKAKDEMKKWKKKSSSSSSSVSAKWARATQWAISLSLISTQQNLQSLCEGGLHEPLIQSTLESALFLDSVISGERRNELSSALERSNLSESRWWNALSRFLQGLSAIARQASIIHSHNESRDPSWNNLALTGQVDSNS